MKIPYVTWRNGRPRFSPSQALRDKGYQSCDLRAPDGGWMTAGQCLDWSQAFQQKLALQKETAAKRDQRKRAKARQERLAALPRPRRAGLTLGELVSRYIEEGMLRPAANTVRAYRFMASNLELVALEAWRSEADAVSAQAMRGIYKLLLAQKSESVALLCIRLVSAAYNWGIEEGMIKGANPAYRLKMVQPEPRLRAATVAEFLHLASTAEREGMPAVAAMLWLGVFTAQRTGDRRELTDAHIRDGRFEITQQKTGAHVSIPVSRWLTDRLHPVAGFLAGIRGQTPEERERNYYYDYGKLRDAAAATMPSLEDFNDQDLRDTAVTWMGRAGATEQEIMAVTGHAQSGRGRILKHYMQRHADMADEAIRKLDAWFEKEAKKVKKERRA